MDKRSALIVGVGGGLSASLARLFAKEGIGVTLAARNADKLAALATEVGATTHACDVAKPDDVTGLFARLPAPPDVVVFNPSARVPGPITDAEGSALFRAAVNLFRLWRISDEEAAILLDLPVPTYRRWKAGDLGRIDRDGKARLSNILGIHKALRIIFREPQRAYAWIKAPNAAFANRTALDVMLGGELTDLMRVRRYLDAERGAW